MRADRGCAIQHVAPRLAATQDVGDIALLELIDAEYTRPHTRRPHPQHLVYPYLLRGVDVIRPNQVWSTDITYIRLARGFVYLVAVIDWYSRKVLSWCLSNTLDSGFCVDCLEQALQEYGKPEIFNTDQGCQFMDVSQVSFRAPVQRFPKGYRLRALPITGVLRAHGIAISMDGRGRISSWNGCGAA